LANTVDPTQASNLETWAANHLPADGLTPVEDFTGPITVTSLMPDPEGTMPQFVEFTGYSDGSSIDTTAITGLKAIFLTDVNSPSIGGHGTSEFTIQGSNGEHIYTSDLATPSPTDNFNIFVYGSGTDHVVMGNDNNDGIYLGTSGDYSSVVLGTGIHDGASLGSGNYQRETANGADATLNGGTGDNQTVVAEGANSTIHLGIGANQTVIAYGADSTITDNTGLSAIIKSTGGGSTLNLDANSGSTGTETVTAAGGGNTVNIGNGGADLTLHLAGGNNIVNVNGSQPTLNIGGIRPTDVIHFAEASDTLANAVITKTTEGAGQHITQVAFTTEIVTLVGWHDAVTFAGDPNIHYI
jgi:hypothetical protein